MTASRLPEAVGVLALQGSFAEHIAALESCTTSTGDRVPVVAVRTPQDLARCRALVLPGGESTTISLLIRKSGLYEPLKDFVARAKTGQGERSLWGTCAGMILLAREIEGPTSEGWEGFDGMDVRVVRNQYGRQLQSFSHAVTLPFLSTPEPLLATFIRAPVLHSLLPPRPPSSSSSSSSAPPPSVEVLGRIPRELVPPPQRALAATGEQAGLGPEADAVMYREGDLLACSWHPELNKGDARVHEWWLREMVLHEPSGAGAGARGKKMP
ncbi:SNO glutamine amidotransferase family-domain-containing protein [Rhodotorula diobovata]|uniref:glutaminase n=1 Tax=Rhodotorula diobovata TaxID=5288 RepID=A0A5C5FWL6_9BASI|nr:SNO glutamine amidotransferase family-domain-containing protein [Rhodotorula diobovata]